ncbi:hypothetical protein [Salininema proteolyticum]|uniref:Uncharacterized protein n=1 Tax=Salininema proteolyticum TaxID=1607685 RepID=A0ABV8TT89_9ACTN
MAATTADLYRQTLQELDTVRRRSASQAEAHRAAMESSAQRAEQLRAASDEGRASAEALAAATRAKPAGGRPEAAAQPDSLDAVEHDLRAAEGDLEEAKYLAHRPAFLPRWRSDERNAVVYAGAALAGLAAQLVALRTWSGDGIVDLLILLAILVAFPLAAFGAGWLAIGVVARPRLGEPEKLVRNPRLGLVIAATACAVAAYAAFAG